MFKVLIRQTQNNLSDERTAFHLRDRLSPPGLPVPGPCRNGSSACCAYQKNKADLFVRTIGLTNLLYNMKRSTWAARTAALIRPAKPQGMRRTTSSAATANPTMLAKLITANTPHAGQQTKGIRRSPGFTAAIHVQQSILTRALSACFNYSHFNAT